MHCVRKGYLLLALLNLAFAFSKNLPAGISQVASRFIIMLIKTASEWSERGANVMSLPLDKLLQFEVPKNISDRIMRV